jgi:hypothetical protein
MTPEKLRDMAKLVHLSNRISAFHEKNLKSYPYVFFENVKSARIEYDFSHHPSDTGPKEAPKTPDEFYKEIGKAAMNMTSNSFVAYHLELDEEPNQPHLAKRFEALQNSIRSLFWKDVIVKVYFNEKIVYESPK